jgi:hypothetical protein
MLWWFERDGRHMHVEVLHLARGGFELHIVDADGNEHIERFANAADLAARQQEIQDDLAARGWKRSGEWLL